jgi:hypothetical protein
VPEDVREHRPRLRPSLPHWAHVDQQPDELAALERVGRVVAENDGWTIRTAARARSAHAEHTIVITDGAPLVLTA